MPARSDRFLEMLPLASDRPLLRYGAAFALTLVALALRLVLDPVIPPGFPYITFLPVAIVATFLFGLGPGILAAVLSTLAAWRFFLPPSWGILLGYQAWVATALYLGVVLVHILLIHLMQRANVRLLAERQRGQELADHAELLFHELQHRVSNNLQMIGAVLSLQGRAVTDPTARQALNDAVAKLQTIGRIQRQLYNPDGAHLALDRFLPDLVRDLVKAGGRPGIECEIVAEPDIQLAQHMAIPVALILAEAVANAVEHGFAEAGAGTLQVRIARDADWLEISVIDDGAGLPVNFDPIQAQSLGLRIARTLAEQLGGEFALTGNVPRGAISRLRFPA